MQIVIVGLLLLIAVLIGSALFIWRKYGWKNKKHLIVMLIVLAAAVQLINLKLVMTGH
ncbi:hypothetical protein O3W44_03335 [Pantoea sp. LMR881]|uniref:hypothetical protein n=1 Tax=Pantoea sp. LMR881 TaxID=3014336 RepID=UPI0022AF2858|nr:hypothetical protein [Pantoea sp. LMR881]MCZ4058329.1 hypothetical protein [Pantoea sp. LMR881]